VFFLVTLGRLDPYLSIFVVAPAFFVIGYAVQRWVIGPASGQGTGSETDNAILLITLGLSIIVENALLAAFKADTRSIDVPYAFNTIDLGFTLLAVPRAIAFVVALLVTALLGLLLTRTDTGKAIRAVAKEKMGAALVGIDVKHIYAVTFGLGAACAAIAACLLMPTFYVSPRAGNAFVLVAFTIVVLGGMGSVAGALVGALVIGVVESFSGLYLGESLGQIGIFLIFILVLLVRPTGLFGAKA
jgi:branched-chain amino acid transport system permease protein